MNNQPISEQDEQFSDSLIRLMDEFFKEADKQGGEKSFYAFYVWLKLGRLK